MLGRLRAVPPEVDPRVFAFSIATMVLMMGVGIIAPVLPLYAVEFGASYGAAPPWWPPLSSSAAERVKRWATPRGVTLAVAGRRAYSV